MEEYSAVFSYSCWKGIIALFCRVVGTGRIIMCYKSHIGIKIFHNIIHSCIKTLTVNYLGHNRPALRNEVNLVILIVIRAELFSFGSKCSYKPLPVPNCIKLSFAIIVYPLHLGYALGQAAGLVKL